VGDTESFRPAERTALVALAAFVRCGRHRRSAHQSGDPVLASRRRRAIITGFFSIVLAFNSGAAFSFLGDASGWQRYLFSAFAVAAAALIVWLLRRGGDRMYCAGLSLILGGALGNLLDRALIGRVVDFILVHDYLPFRPPGGGWLDPFPAFNIADSAITIGAALLIIDSFRQRRTGVGVTD
jgi:signal peptidase II